VPALSLIHIFTVSAAFGCPTVSWAVAVEVRPALSVTVTVTVYTPPVA